jgi:predicted amidohydrolase YtcJ
MPEPMIFRDVEIDGRVGLDVLVRGGRIEEIGASLAANCPEIDGRGGALIPGLIDHHLHLLSWAAQMGSVDLSGVATPEELRGELDAAAAAHATGSWIRATGYHESAAGVLTRRDLDAICPGHKIRVQHRSGALWMLNSMALEAVIGDEQPPDFAERDADGALSGRFTRADAWLRARVPSLDLPIDQASRALARWGVTGFTDASVTNESSAARLIAARVRDGSIRQRVMLMGALALPEAPEYAVGPVKFLLDDSALPDVDQLACEMRVAHAGGRAVAAHCVTLAELAVALAAIESAGAAPGDRIEHGGEINDSAVGAIQRLGLTVVTQPGFIHDKGDRYLKDCDDPDLLYRCGSLWRLGIKVCSSSDAPYGSADPWLAMRTAVSRRTKAGGVLNADERMPKRDALSLYLGGFHDPGGPPRRVEVGAPADLCLLAASLGAALDALNPELVSATMVGGAVVYASSRS